MKLFDSPPHVSEGDSKQILRLFLAQRKLAVAVSNLDTADHERELAYVFADVMRHVEAAAASSGGNRPAAEIFASFEARMKVLLKRSNP